MTMDVVMDIRPFLAVGVSLLAAGLIMMSKNASENVRDAWTILAAILKMLIIFSMVPFVVRGGVYEWTLFPIVENIGFTLRTDAAGMIFAGLSSFLWLLTSFYSIGYMRGHHEKNQTGYFACFALCMSATIGIALAANLVTFIVFFEILTIATYPLVAHYRNEEATFAGRKYLIYTLTTGQLFLLGIVGVYLLAGSTDFVAGGFLNTSMAHTSVLFVLFFLLSLAGMVKAGMMPFHGWLVSAMVAPTPVSALLHAVAVVKAGAFAIIRIVGYVFGPQLAFAIGATPTLAAIAGFTIVVASLIAMQQDNLKRRLAFSTVGQLSYVVLGSCILAQISLVGAMFHIVAHAIMKITLFFCAGAIFVTTGKANISEMRGIGRQMPFTMAAFGIASLGIGGLPFLVGFISKMSLGTGMVEAGQLPYLIILVISAMLSFGYLLPVPIQAFLKDNKEGNFTQYGEANKLMLIPLCITAVLTIVVGIAPNFVYSFYDLATQAASAVFATIIGGGF